MNNNPFADLIPQNNVGANPFADLVPKKPNTYNDEGASWAEQPSAMPRVPFSGLSPEEDAAAWAELNARQPKPEPTFGQKVQTAYTQAANDPFGGFFGAVGKIGEKTGLLDKGAEYRGQRFGRAFGQSLGPIGVEFAPVSALPSRAARPQPMPAQSVRSTAELKSTGGARIGEAKQSDAVVDIKPELAAFDAELRGASLRVHPKLHSSAAPVYDEIVEKSASPQTLEELHYLRQLADDVAAKPGTEGKIGVMMKRHVDAMIAKHPEGGEFSRGVNEYARAMKSKTVEDALEKAKNSVLWDRGKQSAAIRHQVKALLNNKKFRWTPEEQAALKSAKHRTLLEVFGGFGSKNISGAAFGRALEFGAGLPPGILWGPGYLAREGANAASQSKLLAVAERIRAGGPVQESRLNRLSQLIKPEVLTHLLQNEEGARRVMAWVAQPTAQTARALSAYTSQKLSIPHIAERMAAELQGTESGYAEE